MKAKILYGILLFFVGIAMVACGDQDASSSSTPNNVGAAIPVTSNGLGTTNTACANTAACTYTGIIRISNPTHFALMGATSRFENANGNNFDIDSEDLSNLGDFFENIFDNITVGIVFDSHGNIDYGINTNFDTTTQTTLPLPTVGQTRRCAMQVTANRITGSYTHSDGTTQSFDAAYAQTTNGSTIYLDATNNIAVYSATNTTTGSVNSVNRLYIGPYSAQSGIGQAGVFEIQSVY